MSARRKAELGAIAAGSVYAVGQLFEGLRSDKQGFSNEANDHYLKVAAGAAVAIGAYEMLKTEREAQSSTSRSSGAADRFGGHRVKRHQGIEYRSSKKSRRYEDGHTRRMLEEIAGSYALGRELMGDKNHHTAHLVAEALGAVGLLKEARKHRH